MSEQCNGNCYHERTIEEIYEDIYTSPHLTHEGKILMVYLFENTECGCSPYRCGCESAPPGVADIADMVYSLIPYKPNMTGKEIAQQIGWPITDEQIDLIQERDRDMREQQTLCATKHQERMQYLNDPTSQPTCEPSKCVCEWKKHQKPHSFKWLSCLLEPPFRSVPREMVRNFFTLVFYDITPEELDEMEQRREKYWERFYDDW